MFELQKNVAMYLETLRNLSSPLMVFLGFVFAALLFNSANTTRRFTMVAIAFVLEASTLIPIMIIIYYNDSLTSHVKDAMLAASVVFLVCKSLFVIHGLSFQVAMKIMQFARDAGYIQLDIVFRDDDQELNILGGAAQMYFWTLRCYCTSMLIVYMYTKYVNPKAADKNMIIIARKRSRGMPSTSI